MSAFRKFDPRCFRENAESPGEAAKVAKPAKPPPAADPSFSNFSRFSSGNSQSAKYRTSEAATSDQASETVGWTREDWKAFFDERAAIAEFDGKLPRPQAETRAFACCVAEWLNRRRAPTRPGRCAGCGEVSGLAQPSYHSASKRAAIPGFTQAAGRIGMLRCRPRPLRLCRELVLRSRLSFQAISGKMGARDALARIDWTGLVGRCPTKGPCSPPRPSRGTPARAC